MGGACGTLSYVFVVGSKKGACIGDAYNMEIHGSMDGAISDVQQMVSKQAHAVHVRGANYGI